MSWWFATAGEAAQSSSGNYGIPHVAGNLALVGGSQHITVTRSHTAPNLSLTSGTHTATKYVPVHLDAPNMQLVGGASHFTVTRIEVGAHLSLLGGTHVISTGRYIAHTSAHLSLLTGTFQVGTGPVLSAGHLSLLGGNHTTTINIAEITEAARVYTSDESHGNLVGATSSREPMRLTRRTW